MTHATVDERFFSFSPVPFDGAGRSSPVAGVPPVQSLVERACGMVHDLQENARQTENDRRISEETITRFRDAGFFRLMQPARYGGYEYGFTAFIDVISEVARGCASSAWGCSIAAIHQWVVALFPEQAQDDVWGANRDAIVCGSYAPAAMAQRCDGGYRVKGRWQWASNVDNSQWALLGVQFPPEKEGDAPTGGFLLVPSSDWRIEDDWHVAGQAGTGSKTVALDSDTFVPAHRCLTFAEAASSHAPGAEVNRGPFYRIPVLSMIPVCLAAPMIGNAQSAIENFTLLCGNRITRGGVAGAGNRLSQFFPVQSRIAEATAAVDAARLLLYRCAAEIEQNALENKGVDVARRIRNRRDMAFAARLCQQAVDALFAGVGAAGLSLDQPLQRIWRDSNMIVKHFSLNWDAISSMTGQYLLGLDPKGQY
ncbi:flavin-dependent monooxygenase [Trinickia terrae]|uniref:Flavin-dependent monooxygenase n=1 Tax=Trinickia terrae TaxID=2571161 RepID=A0A4U1IF20_9BURK|nr:acyl-CoA dehydrogenase family protein [Trinickia terrae]TKC92262.1 flavin-dependent monooxygenase [Trinickia terrae]